MAMAAWPAATVLLSLLPKHLFMRLFLYMCMWKSKP